MSALESKIKDWLAKQGYPLEMRVAASFRAAGFEVTQSHFYDLPGQDSPREIDVLARVQRDFGFCDFDIAFVIECKSSINKPWLLFSTMSDVKPQESISGRAASTFGRAVLNKLENNWDLRENAVFDVGPRTAYGVRQALSERQDIAYQAVAGITAAASALVSEGDARTSMGKQTMTVVLPVVVVGAPLFEVYLDDRGEVQLEQSPRTTLVWGPRRGVLGRWMIEIMSEDQVETYAISAYSAVMQILRHLTEERRE